MFTNPKNVPQEMFPQRRRKKERNECRKKEIRFINQLLNIKKISVGNKLEGDCK